jgi:predicted NBD/HSP70 family sugar kinase
MPARDLPARQRSLREHNLAVVLGQVASSDQPVSRASIAAQTGLTRATVSTIVDELIAGGLASEVSPPPRNGAGRPASGVVLAGATPAGLGMEINVDYLAVCLVDLAGTIRHRESLPTDQRGRLPEQAWGDLAKLARSALCAAHDQGLTIAGATVALPGLVSGGVVKIAPNLGWLDAAIPSTLEGLPVTAGNEANLAALGELHASGVQSFVYVSGEIGIGAGIVVNGFLFGGTQGWAGELGHVTVDPAGPPCRCGSHGCLEQYAGEDAIRATAGLPATSPTSPSPSSANPRPGSGVWSAAAGTAPGASLSDRASALHAESAGGLSLARLAERAAAGDEPLHAALREAGAALGIALANAVNILDLPVVVLGSHLSPLTPWLKEPIEQELARRVLTSRWSQPTVQASILGADAAIIGAARTVTQEIITNPARYLASHRA